MKDSFKILKLKHIFCYNKMFVREHVGVKQQVETWFLSIENKAE